MHLDLYKKEFAKIFGDAGLSAEMEKAAAILRGANHIFFAGNGGSMSICTHMAEDFTKIAGIPSHAMSDASLITCFANDYGYELVYVKWLESYFTKGDVLVAISSSGESHNIRNAAKYVRKKGGKVITFSGFKANNRLSREGVVNFRVPIENYGVVECFHQMILHIILDSIGDD